MNEAEIRKYAALMKELELTGIEIDESRGYFRLECEQPKIVNATGFGSVPVAASAAPVAKPASYKTVDITSPMVGVFYASPTEDGEPYVKVGDHVSAGDTLCIVEAMKLMNEIVAEHDGVVEKVCATNGQLIEFGTKLFEVKELQA